MFHDYSFNKQLITRLGRLFLIVGDYITKLSSQHGHVIDLLWCLYYWAGLPSDIKDTRFLHQKLMKELRVFFRVPNQEIISGIKPTPSPNQVVPTFINFLLQISEEILRTEPDFIVSIKDSVEILRTELEFLITFLGDKPILKEIDNIFTDIETFVNELGSFLCSTIFIFTYVGDKPISRLTDDEEAKNALMDIKALRLLDFFIFDGNDQAPVTGISDRALSSLLLKMDLVNAKIKEQIIRVSKMPSDVAPRTSVVSPFIVDSVLDDLVHLLTNRADKIIGVNDQIVMLHEELMLLQSSVTDITMQQQTEHKELLIRSTDVAYEVEYIINSFPPFWYLILRLPQLIEKIKLIRMAIKVMKENIVAAGMLEVAKYPGEQVTSQSEEHPILEDVAGLENETIKIVKQLVGGPVRLQVISIFGMPGLGKTTLAKKLYNDPSVVYHFYKRAWCVVSQTYNKRIMLIDILRSISQLKRETIKNKEDELLAEDIYKSLKGMRYLIVMDDIWDINVWNDLKIYFPNDNVGSRILFTTRNKDVGMKVSPHSVINALPFMSKDECWKLLQQKVFGNEQCPPGLLDIGKQIATSCHGLPLAVVVISAVLANMGKKLRLWLEVERNLSSYILENPNDYILILELSYNHLPMHLKPCFLYFGAFKEDIKIPVRKLISLWVAEGFIKKEEQKSPEDVAYEYLMELIDRSLVLVSERRSDGGVKSCEIHDLLRVMCVRIAEEENFLKVVEGRISIYGKHHRLSIDDRAPYACSLHFGLHVRSLLYTSSETPTLTSCGFKVLRVLDSSYRSSDFIDVTEIEQLVHLRYLAVPCTRLPSVESLHRLEFLFVENSEVVEIPEFLLNMINLRHAYFMGGACFGASFRCHATEDESFPINFLQRVSFLSISDKKDEKILRRSPNLHRLKCRVQSSFSPSFYYHNKLDSLSVYYNDSEDSCCGSIILPLNLRKLSLGKICASPKQMEIIGRLLNLEVLKLLDATFEGEQWDTREGEFPRLKFLKLDGVRIAEWNTSSDHFPRLQRIVLQDCHHLKMIHSTIGDIPTLQMIEVYRCAYAIIESAMQIQEEQRDMGNEELKVKISY